MNVVPIPAKSPDDAWAFEEGIYRGDTNQTRAADHLFGNTDLAKLVETYLSERLPEDLMKEENLKEFWAIIGKTPALTFLDMNLLEDLMIDFEIIMIDYIMAKKPYVFTFEDSKRIAQLKLYFKMALLRSVGSKEPRYNERTILGQAIQHLFRSNMDTVQTQKPNWKFW